MKKDDKQSLTIEEKLIKLNNEYSLIPHTNAGRLSSMVRRMKAEKEMEVPINLRSGFAVSTATGKHTNEMDEEEWEDFFITLSGDLKRDYPELYQKIFPIRKGLTKCLICGEYKGKVNKVSVSCLCDGIICPKCHINKMHRPISNYYDEKTNKIWHSPWFMGQAGCSECRNKK